MWFFCGSRVICWWVLGLGNYLVKNCFGLLCVLCNKLWFLLEIIKNVSVRFSYKKII